MRFDFLRRTARPLLASFIFAAMLGPAVPGASAQNAPQSNTQSNTQSQEQTKAQTPAPTEQSTSTTPADAPIYTDFKGIKIGTSREEARKKLGSPEEKDKAQDFFALSDRQRARIYYDEKGSVTAIIVTHVGKSGDVPTPKAILGMDVEPKQDGSIYQIVYYPKAGYWVAYSRTAGDEPLTMITMRKIATTGQ